jgi:hypothetical protein
VDPTTRTRSRSDSTTRPPPRIHVQVCVLLPFSPSHLNRPLPLLISISLLGFSNLETASRRSGARGQKEKVSNSVLFVSPLGSVRLLPLCSLCVFDAWL